MSAGEIAGARGVRGQARHSWRHALALLAAGRAWLFLIVLLVIFEVWAQCSGSTFVFNIFNWRSITVYAVTPLLLALGQTFVIISGGIDLSVGFAMGLSAVVMSHVVNATSDQLGPVPGFACGILAALLISVVPGITNGLLIARLKIPPFIGTLGMYGVARGAAFLLAGGTTVPVRNQLVGAIGNGNIASIPTIVLIAALAVLVMHYLLTLSRFGQHTYAIGGNVNAAVRAGLRVSRHIILLYVLSAVSASAAGIIYTTQFSAGAAQAGEPLLLDSIAAVVIGGASLFGGSGTIVGTVIGALIIAVIQYGLVFMQVQPFWQFITVGGVIIISVLVDQLNKPATKV